MITTLEINDLSEIIFEIFLINGYFDQIASQSH